MRNLYDYLTDLLNDFDQFEHNPAADDDDESGDYNVGAFFDYYDSSGRSVHSSRPVDPNSR